MNSLARRWVGLVICLLLGGTTAVLAQEPPTPPPDNPVTGATPTVDRLAAPPTVAAPTQADDGAQLYWLWCQPCHGDQGQGLTDEWREQYPMEDQYCWNNGCHGNLPYEDGFTLPRHVPAVIGENSLARFRTMSELHTYVSERMPYEYPGALSEAESLAVVAYLARAHGKWDGTTLTNSNIEQFRWGPEPAATAVGTPAAAATADVEAPGLASGSSFWLWGGLLLGALLLGGLALWQSGRR